MSTRVVVAEGWVGERWSRLVPGFPEAPVRVEGLPASGVIECEGEDMVCSAPVEDGVAILHILPAAPDAEVSE